MSPGDREREVLEALAALPTENTVLVGGYAVNAYVPPRFSIDCDIVVIGSSDEVESKLTSLGYTEAPAGRIPHGSYRRYVKGDGKDKVSFDLLVDAVEDRQTGVVFKSAIFEKYSVERTTVGRLNTTRIRLRIADPELLFAMKFVSGRSTDIRDIFMLAGEDLDWSVVDMLVAAHCSPDLIRTRTREIRQTTSDETYRDALQGPFGAIPDGKFDRCKNRLLGALENLGKDR